MFLFNYRPVAYVTLAILKATMAGFLSGLIYKTLDKVFKGKFIYLRTLIASISAPIINTGIFALGMMALFTPQLAAIPANFPDIFGGYSSAMGVLFGGFILFNFIGEFLVSLILSPAIVRIVEIVRKKFI